MKVIIRRPNQSERLDIHKLFDNVIKHTMELEDAADETALINELIEDQQKLIDADFDTQGKEVYFLVAEWDGKPIGTICLRPCSEIILDCAGENAKGKLEIGSVYIKPDFQGKGVARLLLNAMYITLLAKGIEEFYLDSGYSIAKKVWARILGKPSIVMKDYWGEAIDHVIWYRKLSEVSIDYKL